MPGCIFHVSGENFDVDAFLSNSSFRPYRVYHRGETAHRSRIFEDNGFSLDVSSADGDFAVEITDALAFLSTHESELERLRDFPGVADMRLDFGYCRREVSVQCDYLPPNLLLCAGKLGIGIELSLYPACEPESTVA